MKTSIRLLIRKIMNKNEILLNECIDKAGEAYSNSLDYFYPAFNKNSITEKNISYHFAHAFMCNVPNSHAFFEVPFLLKKDNSNFKHIDAYVFNKKIGIFIESKRMYSKGKFQEVCADIERLSWKNISSIYNNKNNTGVIPKKIYKLVIADNWDKRATSWWIGDIDHHKSWVKPESLSKEMVCGAKVIIDNIEDDWYIDWLYAYSEIK